MDEMKYAVIDIETIPAQDLPEEAYPQPDMSKVKYGNTKDPFKRQAIEAAYVEEFRAGLAKKMATNPDYCQIVCVVGKDAEHGFELQGTAKDVDEEFNLLVATWDWLRRKVHNGIPIVTFNGIGFDIPALLRRAIYTDISVSPSLSQALLKDQRYNTVHFDIMQLMGRSNPFSGRLDTINNLDYYLTRFGIGAKTGDGSMVYPWFQEGNLQQILEYCRDGDVEGTARLWERIGPWMVVPQRAA